MRRLRDRIIRWTSLTLAVLMGLGAVSFLLWRREAKARTPVAAEASRSKTEVSEATVMDRLNASGDFKGRTYASNIMFLDGHVIQVNARGEHVPDSEAVFPAALRPAPKGRNKAAIDRATKIHLDSAPPVPSSTLGALVGGSGK